MNYFVAQIILAVRARNGDNTGWMQILIFVFIAVFYAVGSIIKSKAKKFEQSEKEQPPAEPLGKALKRAKALRQQFLAQSRRLEKTTAAEQLRTQPQPLLTTISPAQPVVQPVPIKQKPTTVLSLEATENAKFEPLDQLKESEDFVIKPNKKFEDESDATLPVRPEQEYLDEILSAYEDSEALKRAILHYEILGKPMALRKPTDDIIRR